MRHVIKDRSNFSFEVDKVIDQENMFKHPRFERFMEIARTVSQLSQYDTYRLGAVIVIKGVIVAKGFNKPKTHPVQKKQNAKRFDISDKSNHYIHAEIDALTKCKDMDLSKAEIFIYHIGKQGEQKLARPCAGCMDRIQKSGIKKIHYSTPEGLATEYISKDSVINVKRSKTSI